MYDTSRWCLNWGLWGGVRVRLHASFVLVPVIAVYIGARVRAPDDASWYGLLGAAILLASVVVHEIGHIWAARWLGGSVDLIVLGPLGGMHPPHVPREPQRELTAALAGPVANLAVMIVSGTALLLAGQNLGDILLEPLYPGGLLSGAWWVVTLKMVFWFNWLLLMVNLIPAAPLDGGRALRSVLWPAMGYRGAVRCVSRVGLLVALALCVTAWLLFRPYGYHMRVVPAWLPLVLLAIYLYFNSRVDGQRIEDEDPDDDLFGYDFSQGYTSLDRATTAPAQRRPGFLRRWVQQRQELKQQRLRQIEQEEERRVDQVLVRVKELGIDSLSPEERALLDRVSARYRNRLQP